MYYFSKGEHTMIKARLFKDDDQQIKILCLDGTIAIATITNLKQFYLEFQSADKICGEKTLRWDAVCSHMEEYKEKNHTFAIIKEDGSLVVFDNEPFSLLMESSELDFDQLISVAEYASMVGKSIEQVKVYLRQGRIPNAKKIGRDWVIHKSSVDKYPQDNRIYNGAYKRKANDKK